MYLIKLIIDLPCKFNIKSEFLRFLFVGSCNTIFGYLLYLILLWLYDSPILSYNISYAAGILISYILNLKFVFMSHHSNKKMILFPLVYLLQYTIGFISLYVFLYIGIKAELSGLLIIPIMLPITFFASRFFIKLK